MLGTGQDITERYRLESERDALVAAERRAEEFREAFVDVISHELRTPITTILGTTELLARRDIRRDEATVNSMFDDVRSEAARLHRLVEDLLVLSRAERGHLSADVEPVVPLRVVEQAVAKARHEMPTIRIDIVASDDLPIVLCEVSYLEQVLHNLLDNAAKYTPPGTIVTVGLSREADMVTFRVCDAGPGIPEGSEERLFELFYRDPESARDATGSGIGLFVCARLVEAMGGQIWAARRPEGGSEFAFRLRILDDVAVNAG
jgi:two-component system sensor histidine kinase KdpD